jgi:adenylate cyclase class IV
VFEELEYKYRADTVKLSAFRQLMGTLPTVSHLVAASWDVYYAQQGNEDSFQRFRMDLTKPELTKKVKTKDGNNWVRVESDLPLDPVRVTEERVAFHVGLDGYKENFRIFKYCDIFFLEDLNYVFYIVYDRDMKEVGHFIEVEVNKHRVAALESQKPGASMEALRAGEQVLAALGITAQNRLKKSLFELLRKETP